jgi:hypothetical protein
MADGPRRVRPVPTMGDRWRNETVQGHISASVTTRRTRRQDPSPSDQTLHSHISAPVTIPRTRRRDPSPLVQTLDGHISAPVTKLLQGRGVDIPHHHTKLLMAILQLLSLHNPTSPSKGNGEECKQNVQVSLTFMRSSVATV